MKKIQLTAAIFALTGVVLGAFGAHGLKSILLSNGSTETWKTAVFYHLTHAIAAWALGLRENSSSKWDQRAGQSWLIGIILFSGSLYALALGGPKILGPVTPLGGLAMIIGWGFAAKATFDHQAHD